MHPDVPASAAPPADNALAQEKKLRRGAVVFAGFVAIAVGVVLIQASRHSPAGREFWVSLLAGIACIGVTLLCWADPAPVGRENWVDRAQAVVATVFVPVYKPFLALLKMVGKVVGYLFLAALAVGAIGLVTWGGSAIYESLSLKALVGIAVVLLIILVMRGREG
jgi:hypothetical protein